MPQNILDNIILISLTFIQNLKMSSLHAKNTSIKAKIIQYFAFTFLTLRSWERERVSQQSKRHTNNMLKIFAFLTLSCLLGGILVDACGGGRRKPPPRCQYKTCHASYTGWQAVQVSANQCKTQYNRVRHHYQTHTRNGGCPGTQNCHQRDQTRRICKCAHTTIWYTPMIYYRLLHAI